MRRLWRRLCADPGSPPVLGAPRIEIYARLARATKQRASRRDWRNRTIRKGGEAAEIELTYSATGDISQAKPALGRLIVCIIQVGTHPVRCWGSGGAAWRPKGTEIYGNIYDHFAVDYEYANGVRMSSYCRQYEHSYQRVNEIVT